MCIQGAERSVVSLEYEDHEGSMGGDVEVGRGSQEDDRTQRGGRRVSKRDSGGRRGGKCG